MKVIEIANLGILKIEILHFVINLDYTNLKVSYKTCNVMSPV